MNLQEKMAKMVQDAALAKGYTGVMSLRLVLEKRNILKGDRVSKVWRGNLGSKIIDYIKVMNFLDAEILIEPKNWGKK